MKDWFVRHPRAVGETYSQHFRFAAATGVRLLAASLACLVHALAPALFERTASGVVRDLHQRMLERR